MIQLWGHPGADSGVLVLIPREFLDRNLTRQLLGYFPTHHLLGGGGGVKRPQPITREPIAEARRARLQTKACDKTLQLSSLKFNFEVTGQVKGKDRKLDHQQDGPRDFVFGISHNDGKDCAKSITAT